jgi:hypothetical protein
MNKYLSGKEPPRAPAGRVRTGMASFCMAPPSTEQLEQQQRGSQQEGWEDDDAGLS